MEWRDGVIVAGHGVAGGRSVGKPGNPYPAGTIRLQQAYFLRAGIDLSPYFSGTLNVDLAPYKPQAKRIVFDGMLYWHGNLAERFTLAKVECRVAEREFEGLWYFPHPETKPAHFQRDTVVELLLPYIQGIAVGDAVSVGF